jgi:hypothetical protein
MATDCRQPPKFTPFTQNSVGEAKTKQMGEILPQHDQNRPKNRTGKLQGMFHVKHPLQTIPITQRPS